LKKKEEHSGCLVTPVQYFCDVAYTFWRFGDFLVWYFHNAFAQL